jgi:hypothetical protein
MLILHVMSWIVVKAVKPINHVRSRVLVPFVLAVALIWIVQYTAAKGLSGRAAGPAPMFQAYVQEIGKGGIHEAKSKKNQKLCFRWRRREGSADDTEKPPPISKMCLHARVFACCQSRGTCISLQLKRLPLARFSYAKSFANITTRRSEMPKSPTLCFNGICLQQQTGNGDGDADRHAQHRAGQLLRGIAGEGSDVLGNDGRRCC